MLLDSASSFPWIPALYTRVFSTVLCMWAEMVATGDASATETVIVYGFEPVWGVAFAWFLLGERWDNVAWLGAALVLCGSLTVQLFGLAPEKSKEVKTHLRNPTETTGLPLVICYPSRFKEEYREPIREEGQIVVAQHQGRKTSSEEGQNSSLLSPHVLNIAAGLICVERAAEMDAESLLFPYVHLPFGASCVMYREENASYILKMRHHWLRGGDKEAHVD